MPADHFDVVIIGAGVAGALIADVLAARHVNVLLLEAGETGGDRGALTARWAAATVKGLGAPYVASRPERIPGPEQPATEADRKNARDVYYDQQTPEKYLSTYERRVGGSTWHWLGHTPRLLPNDFRLRSTYGVGVDWPVGYADLEPWYCKAEKELGVAGDDAEWQNVHGAFRSQPFPMSKIWPSWSDELFSQALREVPISGRRLAVLSTPSARNSQAYDGRPPCAGNASCVPICPIGAKYDGSVHVKKSVAKGAQLWEKSVALRLEKDADGGVRTVHFKRWDQSEARVRGRLVIVAANAIESAKLLLLSGVANSSDQVGRNLMDHLQKAVLGSAREPVYPFRGPPSTSGIETFRDGEFRKMRGAFRMSLGNDGWSRSGSPQTDVARLIETEGLFGRELRERLFHEVSRQVRMSCSVEVLPNPANRVTLSPLLDSFGVPRPQLHFATDDYTRDAFGPALDVIQDVLRALDATVTSLDRNPRNYSGAGHIMGTCRMGFDAKTAVVDADCRSFDHRNLYVVGAGAFPTCGTANPTLTVAALALRAADHVLSVLPALAAAPVPA
ncbi:MAG: glucose dehydrogenase [Gammaproteobacteria bacterium]|jgi:choline dehydrogenase-like flavoprotein|nr:glucose dehydrogenase [Gammaproteobacteria bacterium]